MKAALIVISSFYACSTTSTTSSSSSTNSTTATTATISNVITTQWRWWMQWHTCRRRWLWLSYIISNAWVLYYRCIITINGWTTGRFSLMIDRSTRFHRRRHRRLVDKSFLQYHLWFHYCFKAVNTFLLRRLSLTWFGPTLLNSVWHVRS